jgi:TonB C terminal
MSTFALPADVRGSDLALAVVLTVAVFAGSLFALRHARLEHTADLPGIDPGGGMAIAVRPVADLPSGKAKKGARKPGRDDKRVSDVPAAWRRKVPRATTPKLSEDSPTVQPEPEPTDAQAIPAPADELDPESPIDPESPPEELPDVEPDPADEIEDPPAEDSSTNPETPDGTPVEDGGEAPAAEGEGEAPAEGEAGEGDGQAPAEGETEGVGGGDGTDPLLERAIAFYRARLVAWFASRFRVTGSGLSEAQLAKYRVRVHIDVGDDLRIVDYQILSSDHPDFDKAARSTLEKMRGMKLPPPPENYPGAVQRQLTVTFTCAPDSCD